MNPSVGAKGEVTVQEPDRATRTIARRSAESRATVPDYELSAEVTVSEPAALTTAALVHACARALRLEPRANAAYRDGQYELYSRINVGVVVVAGDTFAIPTIFDADERATDAIADELERLGARAAAGQLLAPETSGATFTLWHPGRDGVTQATPLVIPPQAAAVAAGAVRDVPVVRQGAIVPGHLMTITLACDHRILYGAHASGFLGQIRRVMEESAG